MGDLIKALQLLLKYGNPEYPTHCEHDVMQICGIEPSEVSTEDKEKLEALGFHETTRDGEDCFISYTFGSA